MTKGFDIQFTGCTNPFDDWFIEEKGTSDEFELESDVDEVDFDTMDDKDEY